MPLNNDELVFQALRDREATAAEQFTQKSNPVYQAGYDESKLEKLSGLQEVLMQEAHQRMKMESSEIGDESGLGEGQNPVLAAIRKHDAKYNGALSGLGLGLRDVEEYTWVRDKGSSYIDTAVSPDPTSTPTAPAPTVLGPSTPPTPQLDYEAILMSGSASDWYESAIAAATAAANEAQAAHLQATAAEPARTESHAAVEKVDNTAPSAPDIVDAPSTTPPPTPITPVAVGSAASTTNERVQRVRRKLQNLAAFVP